MLVILVGNLAYFLTGLASLQGPSAGHDGVRHQPSPVRTERNRVPSLFNWITQVGFETEGIAIIVLAGLASPLKAGVSASDGLKVGLIIGAVILQAMLPFVGHAAMLKVLKWLSLPFVALFVIMAIITASKVNLHSTPYGAGWGMVMVFFALVISAGGLGWTENANDIRVPPPEHQQVPASCGRSLSAPESLPSFSRCWARPLRQPWHSRPPLGSPR